MKLSMARVSVSSCSPHTSSSMLLARHRLALALDQVAQQVGLHQREWKHLVAHVQFQQVEVDRLVVERERIVLAARGAAMRGTPATRGGAAGRGYGQSGSPARKAW